MYAINNVFFCMKYILPHFTIYLMTSKFEMTFFVDFSNYNKISQRKGSPTTLGKQIRFINL